MKIKGSLIKICLISGKDESDRGEEEEEESDREEEEESDRGGMEEEEDCDPLCGDPSEQVRKVSQ